MADLAEKIRLLSSTELFSPLGEKAVKKIARWCSVYSFPKGEAVFTDGDPGDALYIVDSGEISINRLSEDLRRQEIARLVAGDCFGEMELMTGQARNAEALAAEKSLLLRFPRRGLSLTALLEEHADAGAELLHSFLKVTAGRIRNANALLKENSPLMQELRSQVYGDKLTGLYNKTYLEEKLPEYLKDKKSRTALLMVKPDNFKAMNDTFGHEAGDETLVLMAAVVKRCLPENAVAVRFMGNELSCLLPDTDRKGALAAAEAIRGILSALDLSQLTGGADFHLSVSTGIAVFPDHAASAPDLIARAHELPLIGRERGGNRILFPEDK
jgi:diguanylate cyclase (GGDEF)-like protein